MFNIRDKHYKTYTINNTALNCLVQYLTISVLLGKKGEFHESVAKQKKPGHKDHFLRLNRA